MRFLKIIFVTASIVGVGLNVRAQPPQLEAAHSGWGPNARQAVLNTVLEKSNTSRTRTWAFIAPLGYKICYATTNENSARPKGIQGNGPTDYYFSEKSPYFSKFTVVQGCPDGGVSASALGAGICAAAGCDPRAGAAAGGILGTITNNTCGLFNGNAWFDGNAVFILFPDDQQCPSQPRQSHVMPWEQF